MFEVYQSKKSGEFYFRLKDKNGQVIGSSQYYESISGMENGIESVRKNAPNAEVKDLTG